RERARAAHLGSDLVRVAPGDLLIFAARVFASEGALLAFKGLDRWGRLGVAGFGVAEFAVSAISSPNSAATSLSSSIFAAAGAALLRATSCPAMASNSFSSTPRSTKRRWGFSSSLAPTP